MHSTSFAARRGKAGNLNGQDPARRQSVRRAALGRISQPADDDADYGPTLFAQAAAKLGCKPFPHPTGNMSRPYINPLGAQLGACTYCGFCEKFGCGNYSKASRADDDPSLSAAEAELHAAHRIARC